MHTTSRIKLMRLPRLVLLAGLLLVGAIAMPASASAATVSDCQALIAQTQADTAAATTFSGRNAEFDRANLIDKLNNATAKLNVGEFADAIQKLEDFKTKINQLQAAGKLGAEDANRLLADANAAIACIQTL